MYRSNAPAPFPPRLRLAPGRHGSPGEGVCVVELASLLARERFSDRPRCVCPVIAAFLRGWNDRSAYADRQRLRPYAARIVGSRADALVTRERRELCLEWADVSLPRGPVRRFLTRMAMRVRIANLCGPVEAIRLDEGAGDLAARVLSGRRDVERAFVLLDAMLALGGSASRGRPTTGSSVNGQGHRGHPISSVPSNGNSPVPAKPARADADTTLVGV